MKLGKLIWLKCEIIIVLKIDYIYDSFSWKVDLKLWNNEKKNGTK